MKSQTRLSVRSINQSNRSISVRLSFLFCSRAFISRSYENRSNHLCLVKEFLRNHLIYLSQNQEAFSGFKVCDLVFSDIHTFQVASITEFRKSQDQRKL